MVSKYFVYTYCDVLHQQLSVLLCIKYVIQCFMYLLGSRKSSSVILATHLIVNVLLLESRNEF